MDTIRILKYSEEEKKELTKRITYMSVLINVFLAAVKIITGIYGSSKSAVADGVHSLSDLSTDLAIIIGVRFWSAPPDEKHPYGHGKIESLITFFIGTVLASVGLGIGYEAVSTVRDPHIEPPSWISILGIGLSIVLKEILYRRTIRIGKLIKSSSVIANAWHHRSDSFSSIPALLAVLISILVPGFGFVDHVGAMIVAFIIIKVSSSILISSLGELTDSGIDKKDIEEIRNIVMSVPEVKGVHAVRSRRYNSGNFIDLHILVDDDMSVRDGHYIAEMVKNEILEKGPSVIDAVVHIEPYLTHDLYESVQP